MKPVCRIGDMCSGHGGFPSREVLTGQNNFRVDGIPVVTIGDYWATHCDGNSCHDSFQATGAAYFRVNGIPVARVGDSVACGSFVMTGASNFRIQ